MHITFQVSLKQYKLGKARYIFIQHGKWLIIYSVGRPVSFAENVIDDVRICKEKYPNRSSLLIAYPQENKSLSQNAVGCWLTTFCM
jgi:hypothetical protein